MRKIEKDMLYGWLADKPFKCRNTQVVVVAGIKTLYLHGNTIAKGEVGKPTPTTVTMAGWNTCTTRSRLNALPNVNCYMRKGVAYINGIIITDNQSITI